MKGNSHDHKQASFLMNGLSEQLNPKHPFCQLSRSIDWPSLEDYFTRLYSRRGSPAKAIRLMISLLLLKQLHDLSDDQVVERWIENPYWQFLNGEKELQWSARITASDLTHFSKRIGKKGVECLLKLSEDLFHPKIKQEEVVVDTTVQEKNITFPTNTKLTKKVIDTCRKIAKKEDIPLRQSYIRTAPDLLSQSSYRKTPKQKKKFIKVTPRMRTIRRAMVREMLLRMNDKQLKPHVDTLFNSSSILFQQKIDKDKIYNLHEPHVECISKDKAHKLHEFCTKVSIAITRDSGIILGTIAMPGKPYDGHTVEAVPKQLRSTTGTQTEVLITDSEYRGEKYFGKTQLFTPSKPNHANSDYKKRKQRKRLRKRAGIKATICHLKQDFGLGRCFLKAQIGDQINVTLSSVDYNLRKCIRLRM